MEKLKKEQCPYCSRSNGSHGVLSNGQRFHHNCYEDIEANLAAVHKELSSLQEEARSTRATIARLGDKANSIFSFFSRSQLAEDIHIENENLAQILEAQALSEEDARVIYNDDLKPLYDFWLSYPPDWETRSLERRREEGRCERCRQTANLQAHHILALSKGGSHLRSNIEVLCRSCHEGSHGGTFYPGGKNGSKFENHLRVIGDAIENRRKLEMSYKDANGKKTKRIIIPKRLIELETTHMGQDSLCIDAYCELRKEDRNFAVRRITGLAILS